TCPKSTGPAWRENVRAPAAAVAHKPAPVQSARRQGLHAAATLPPTCGATPKLFLTVLRLRPRLRPSTTFIERTNTRHLTSCWRSRTRRSWRVWPVDGEPRAQQRWQLHQGAAGDAGRRQQFLRLPAHVQRGDEPADNNTNNTLLTHIRSARSSTINEFVEIVLKACMSGLADEIISGGMVGKIADNFLKHIFVPQNEALLQSGSARTTRRRRRPDPATTPGRQEPPHLKAMRDPVESLAVWCVLTGRLRLAPYFLRQEDFDTIPQALLLAKILRSLGRRRDIEDVYANKATKMAITCEGIAMQALRSIKDVDVTPNNCLTMELVMLRARHLRRLQHLGAGGQGRIQQLRHHRHRALAIACGFVPLLLPAAAVPDAPLRAHEPDYVRLRPSSISESSGNADGRCRRMRSAPEASSEQGVALLQRRRRKQQKQPEEEQQPRPRLRPLAELLRLLPDPLRGDHQELLLGRLNVIDITAITCGFTAFALRIHNSTVHNPFQRYWSLVACAQPPPAWCTGCACSTLSVVLESLGPKLKMMSLIALQYPEGKSIQSTRHRRSRERQRDHPRHVPPTPSTPSWASTGSTTSCPATSATSPGRNINDGDEPDCVHPIGAVLGAHGILLLNVIVAMFSKTIDAIDSESKACGSSRSSTLSRSSTPGRRCAALQHPVGACATWRPSSGADCAAAPAPAEEQRGQPPLPLCRRGRARIPQPRVSRDTPARLQGCTCSACTTRRWPSATAARPSTAWCWTQEDLDEGNKIIFQQNSTALKRRSSSWMSLVKELKAISLRGPSNISNKRASVLAMPYIEEPRREEGP
uniref:Calponin-homology (CH) domain-containing protein n=1 Tax=Macrostomum lignano TaxID=282301 RepID=A0A1I8FKH2_9PLAT